MYQEGKLADSSGVGIQMAKLSSNAFVRKVWIEEWFDYIYCIVAQLCTEEASHLGQIKNSPMMYILCVCDFIYLTVIPVIKSSLWLQIESTKTLFKPDTVRACVSAYSSW